MAGWMGCDCGATPFGVYGWQEKSKSWKMCPVHYTESLGGDSIQLGIKWHQCYVWVVAILFLIVVFLKRRQR